MGNIRNIPSPSSPLQEERDHGIQAPAGRGCVCQHPGALHPHFWGAGGGCPGQAQLEAPGFRLPGLPPGTGCAGWTWEAGLGSCPPAQPRGWGRIEGSRLIPVSHSPCSPASADPRDLPALLVPPRASSCLDPGPCQTPALPSAIPHRCSWSCQSLTGMKRSICITPAPEDPAQGGATQGPHRHGIKHWLPQGSGTQIPGNKGGPGSWAGRGGSLGAMPSCSFQGLVLAGALGTRDSSLWSPHGIWDHALPRPHFSFVPFPGCPPRPRAQSHVSPVVSPPHPGFPSSPKVTGSLFPSPFPAWSNQGHLHTPKFHRPAAPSQCGEHGGFLGYASLSPGWGYWGPHPKVYWETSP